MKLYLVQHGEAKSEAEDPERSLTMRGEKETRKVSGAAKRLGLRPSRIYHSGKKRTEQTAGIIAGAFGLTAQPGEGLNPVGTQGRRLMHSNCSKCLSKAKPLFSLRDLMTEKLVQSVKLKSLSAYRLKMVKAVSSVKGVTVTISIKPLFFRFSQKRTAI